MAGIDKLYVKYYEDLKDLRNWALIYCPKLFIWWYSDALTMSDAEFYKRVNGAAETRMRHYLEYWTKMSPDNTLNGAIAHFMNAPYYMSADEAEREAVEAYNNSLKSMVSVRDEITIPIMNTPFKIDKKLKWICPVPCVREYLKNNCGVKEHWYYKIFWKGKKYFAKIYYS